MNEQVDRQRTLQVEDVSELPPKIVAAQEAFARDLSELLKSHQREWVAYHGSQQLGFARSQTELFEQCLRRGLQEDEFIIRSVEPSIADQDLVFPNE